MIRDVVKIDENLCDGCGVCIPNCHEGALQIIDGKARLISDLMCDGLGACLGHCPQDAITIEQREAAPYNETEVMKLMIEKGRATVVAHLKHLKDHNEMEFLREGIQVLNGSRDSLGFSLEEVISEVNGVATKEAPKSGCGGSAPTPNLGGFRPLSGGCPGSISKEIKPTFANVDSDSSPSFAQSELRQWPIQMHLINPNAEHFTKCDLLVAADCSSFSMGGFHQNILRGKKLAIACPKLDSNQDIYIDKLVSLIDRSEVNTITVVIMEVPCCGGLLRTVKQATEIANRKVPVKAITISINGEILKEEWI